MTFEDTHALEEVKEPWDQLAVESGKPYSAPGWMLRGGDTWPPLGHTSVVAVLEGLVGIARYSYKPGEPG